jgi:hypothetical protein
MVIGVFANRSKSRGFVLDRSAVPSSPVDLGYGTSATGVAGRTVVGSSLVPYEDRTHGRVHAVAWTFAY